jgi:HlyD family secretion protein
VQADLAVTVANSGSVKAAKSLDLAFQVGGRVLEVYVTPNQSVVAGEKLARVDDQDLRLQVQQAEADLISAQARLQQAQEGKATPQDTAEGNATLLAAQAALTKARTANVTPADIREAEASVRSAQAQLDALKNPSPDKLSSAQTAVAQAKAELKSAQDRLSAAKTNAELTLQRSTDDLTKAQSSYATVASNWEFVQSTGQDPTAPTVTNADGTSRANKLTDTQRQQYYDSFVQAQANLSSAEKAVQQAQVAFDAARQAEQTGVQQAEAKLADAEQQLATLHNPSSSALAQAQANLAQAQARLQKLREGGTAADIQSAQAQVDSAKASLERLTAPAAPSEIAIAQADVAQAQAKVDAAKSQLDRTVLTAPFGGTITALNIVPGSIVSAGATGVASVSDMSSLLIEVGVSESDVASIKTGQSAAITFDALPGKTFSGTVASVATAGTKQNNLVTYGVIIQFKAENEAVKAGMTADVDITVDQHANVIQVPSGAVRTQGPLATVDVITSDNARATVQVETGLSNGTMTEIVRCVATNNQCLRPGDKIAIPELADQAGVTQGQNALIPIGNGPGGGGKPMGPPQQIVLP